MNRIAPNNQLPATHFIEVWNSHVTPVAQNKNKYDCISIKRIDANLMNTKKSKHLYTSAIFRIRENKLPTKHKFNK